MQNYITNNVAETKKLAGQFARGLKGGEVVCLYGELGAGKTVFVQGMMEYFLPKKRVLSPTFIIVRHYQVDKKNIKRFLHIDLYRMKDTKEIAKLEFFEFMKNTDTVIAIEWAEKLKGLIPKERIDIRIDSLEDDRRKIEIDYV